METKTVLPIRRIRLYQHGLGYFEHQGSVEGNDTLELNFLPTAMGELLRTLSVLDLDGGHIAGIRYPAEQSFERQLEWNALVIDSKEPWQGLPEALTGQAIEIESTCYTGQGSVIGVHQDMRADDLIAYLTLQTSGGIRRIQLDQVNVLRPMEPAFAEQLNQWLALRAAQTSQRLSRVEFDLRGEGSRRLNLSYTQPHPAWRMTYRLLLTEGGLGRLQGLAIIDNPSPHAWHGVELSLISGKPRRSYLPVQVASHSGMKSQPRKKMSSKDAQFMMSKPSGGLFDSGSLDSALDELYGEPLQDVAEIQARQEALSAVAETAIGKLHLEYHLNEPVSLPPGRSALVPVLTENLHVQRVLTIRTRSQASYPQAAIRLENTTPLVLDSGPVVVMEQASYLGEGDLGILPPGKRQLLEYGDERRVEISCRPDIETQRELAAIKIGQCKLMLTWREHRVSEVDIQSRLHEDAEIVIIHPCSRNQHLVSQSDLATTRENDHLQMQGTLPAGASKRYRIELTEMLANTQDVQSFSLGQFKALSAHQQQIIRESLQELWQKQNQIRKLEQAFDQKEEDIKQIVIRQQRLNANLKALDKQDESKALRKRYLDQLTALDQQAETLEQELEATRQSIKDLKQHLETWLEKVEFEHSFERDKA